MNPGRITLDVAHNVRRFGIVPAMGDAAYRAANRCFPLTIIKGMTAEARDVDPDWFTSVPVATRFVSRQELLVAAATPDWAPVLDPATVDEYSGCGDRCVGCFDGDQLVAIGWYARRPTPISDHHTLHFDPAWVYMHHGYTLPAWRGQRLHAAGMSWAVHEYTREDARGLISYVDANNLASLRSVTRMGYRIFGQICVARLGGRDFTIASAGCRAYQFSLVRSGGEVSAARRSPAPRNASPRAADPIR